MKRDVVVGVMVLLVAGCAVQLPAPAEVTPGQSGAADRPSPTSGVPSGEIPPTVEPGSFPSDEDNPEITEEMLNPAQPPLPEPTIEDIDQIVEAMFNQGQEEQAVVSMLRSIGFGLYTDDGVVIRKGTEMTADDFSLSESQAYGLVAMLRAQADGETWMTFREFHDELVEFGLEATPEELLQAYQTAYALEPDAAMTRIVQSQAFLELDAEIPPLGIWLLFVDGMIPPNGEGQAIALVGAGYPTGAQPRPRAGVAFSEVQSLLNNREYQRNRDAAHIRAAMEGASVQVTGPSFVHEGHNAPGQPATFTASVNSRGVYGTSNLCEGGSLGGVPVAWDFDQALSGHGTTSVASDTVLSTDGSGRVQFTFTPKQEDMRDGPTRGHTVREVAHLTASVNRVSLARAMCPGIPVFGNRTGPLPFQTHQIAVGWHVPKSIQVQLENEYEIWFNNQLGGKTNLGGSDSFVGRLFEKDDGTWKGTFLGLTQGGGTGSFWANDPACPLIFQGYQLLEVFGEKRPGRLPGKPVGTTEGDFVLEFFPEAPTAAVVGTGDCPSARRPGSRYPYAPFNDGAIWDPNVGLALVFPTQELTIVDYPIVSNDSTVTIQRTKWRVEMWLDQDE